MSDSPAVFDPSLGSDPNFIAAVQAVIDNQPTVVATRHADFKSGTSERRMCEIEAELNRINSDASTLHPAERPAALETFKASLSAEQRQALLDRKR